MGLIMQNKELELDASLTDVLSQYKVMRDHYYESMEKFSRNFDILKHSKANRGGKVNEFGFYEEEDEILEIFRLITDIKKEYDHFDSLTPDITDDVNHFAIVRDIIKFTNIMPEILNTIEVKTNKLRQDLPIVQSIQIFIREARERLGKFCTAVMNLFMKIEPEKEAAKAKASITHHFKKLQESIENHKEDIKKKPRVKSSKTPE